MAESRETGVSNEGLCDRCGSRVRVKRTSVSSGERVSESDPEPGNVAGEKDMVSRVEDTPPLPWKKCYRSTSQISRQGRCDIS